LKPEVILNKRLLTILIINSLNNKEATPAAKRTEYSEIKPLNSFST